jgi:hypothetical protein
VEAGKSDDGSMGGLGNEENGPGRYGARLLTGAWGMNNNNSCKGDFANRGFKKRRVIGELDAQVMGFAVDLICSLTVAQ